jgi:hypothetical protein
MALTSSTTMVAVGAGLGLLLLVFLFTGTGDSGTPATSSGSNGAVATTPRSAPETLVPWMSLHENALIQYYMKGRDAVYLEWGSGGSTFAYASLAKKAFSIEHNREWCDILGQKLKSSPEMK